MMALAFASPTYAQDSPAKGVESVLIDADELSHDRDLGLVKASGTVEVNYQGRTLLTDTLVYNQRQDMLTASGNVSLLEPTGDVLFADFMELTSDMKNGIVEALRIRLADSSRIAAAQAKRIGGTSTEMTHAVYSPCAPCEKDPSRPPLWQIKAVKVIHDQTAQSIEYKDAWLELGGFPVAYTPYLSHPDPTVKRKSGFLTPSFGGSSDLGFILRTPYYWNIAPNRDATVTPIVTGEMAFGGSLAYRHLLQNGEIKGDGSVIYDDDSLRGHIDASGRFDVNDTWRWGVDANATSNDTFMRRFGFQSADVLQSRLYAEGFRGRNYAHVSTIGFQDLRSDANPNTTPIVLPMAEFQHVGLPNRFGLRTDVDASMVALTRKQGQDTRRLSLGGGWALPYIGPKGDVYTLSARLRGDLYHVNSLARNNGQSDFTGVSGRLYPEARLEWRYPLVKDQGTVHQVIEPIVAFAVSPYGGNSDTIPNEDSQDFEFDDTNLFSANRFSGYDRVEGGPRVNYGVKWGVFGTGGGSTTLIVGQSARYKVDDTFSGGSGLDSNFSDIVGALHVSPTNNLDLQYRTRMSYESFDPRRTEIGFSAGPALLNVNANYVYYDRQEDSEYAGRKELTASLSSQMSRFWKGSLSSIRDMDDDGGQRQLGLTMTYEDECLTFSTDLNKSFYQDRDVKPSSSIMFRLTFKTLGEVNSGISQ